MAFDIKDRLVVESVRNVRGFKLVCDFISKKEGYPVMVDSGIHCLTIQTYCNGFERDSRYVSNTVTLQNNSIVVNPSIDEDGVNYTRELYEYILLIPSLLILIERDRKIVDLLNEL